MKMLSFGAPTPGQNAFQIWVTNALRIQREMIAAQTRLVDKQYQTEVSADASAKRERQQKREIKAQARGRISARAMMLRPYRGAAGESGHGIHITSVGPRPQ